MNLVRAQFRFNKAGQGCFYTGWFQSAKNCFSLAYDCGTDSNPQYLENEILKFKTRLRTKNNNRLNLLIISHFDRDHINKIEELLKGLAGIDKVILPYILPEERMWQYFSSDFIDLNYQAFLIDPVRFISQRTDVGSFIFITEGGEDNEGGGNDNPAPKTGPDLSFNLDIRLKAHTSSKLDRNEYLTDSKVNFYYDKSKIFLNGVWEFYFFNKPTSKTNLQKFENNMKKDFPDLFNGTIDMGKLQNIFTSHNHKKVRGKYHEDFELKNREVNSTSLLFYHSPINAEETDIFEIKKHWYRHKDRKVISDYPATLLTGDIYLKGLILSPFLKKKIEKVSFMQIPHHGSEHKWDFSILNVIAHRPIFALINFGLGNKHDHPRQIVIDDLKKAGWKIKINHQLKSYNYYFHLLYK